VSYHAELADETAARAGRTLASTIPDFAVKQVATEPRERLPKAIHVDGRTLWYANDPAGGSPVVTCKVDGSEIDLSVSLFSHDGTTFNSKLPWMEGSGGTATFKLVYPGFESARQGYSWRRVLYDVHVLLEVQPPENKPAPTYRTWLGRFFPGGLPTLGKRQ